MKGPPERPIPVREFLAGQQNPAQPEAPEVEGEGPSARPEEGREASDTGRSDPDCGPGDDASTPGGSGVERPGRDVGPEAWADPAAREGASPRSERVIEGDGVRWRVRVAGRTRTGFGLDAGAVLLDLRFEPQASGEDGGEGATAAGTGGTTGEGRGADAGGAGLSTRGVLVPARNLDELSDDDLLEALGRFRARNPTPG